MDSSIDRALQSLEGLSVGDAFGECFFFVSSAHLAARQLPPAPWRWTDDTHMALSVVEVLTRFGRIDQDALAQAFAGRYAEQPDRGYGAGARVLLRQLRYGADWREAAPALFGSGSWGNGAAMRAAPIGGFFAGDPARAAEEARLAAQITHAHLEGQAGARAVAAAAAFAATTPRPTGRDFLAAVLSFVPACLTRSGIEAALRISPASFDEAVRTLGTGNQVAARDTVPFCLWCAAYHLDDFPSAMWQTVAGLGDRDTTCAIVAGIVALSAPSIPSEWLARREPLPSEFRRR